MDSIAAESKEGKSEGTGQAGNVQTVRTVTQQICDAQHDTSPCKTIQTPSRLTDNGHCMRRSNTS